MSPKYPNVTIELVGNDGNAMNILGTCTRIARHADVPEEELDLFFTEATSGNYDHLIQTCTKWFNIT